MAEGGGESSGAGKPATKGADGEKLQEAAAKTATSSLQPPPNDEELADVEDVDESLFAEDLDDELAELELS